MAEIDDLIHDAALTMPSGSKIHDEAEAVVSALELRPDWEDWLREQAVRFIADRMRTIQGSERAYARTQQASRRFAIDRANGIVPSRAPLLIDQYLAVDENDFRKRLGDMDRDDLLFVADKYRSNAKTALFEEAFCRAIAMRLGPNDRVRDVYAEEDLRDLRDQLPATP